MTYYLGSKADHADEILAVVLAKRKPGQTFVDAFTGGANIICRVPQADGPRIGADINPYMIALHTALSNGWDPPEHMDEKTYHAIKKNPKKFITQKKNEMAEAVKNLDFETAALLRDELYALTGASPVRRERPREGKKGKSKRAKK